MRIFQLQLTYTIPLVCTPLQDQFIEVAQQMYEHLVDLDFADDSLVQCGSQVDLLIGNDFYWTFFTGRIKRGESGPVAMESKLGWILSGPVPREDMSSVSTNVVSSHTLRVNTQLETNIVTSNRSDDLLVEQVKQFWELESIGVLPNEGTVRDKFLDSIHQVEGRYEVNLPGKEHHRLLPDNYEVAISRLNSVLKQLKKTHELLQEYNHIIEEQSEKDIVSDVDLNAPVAGGKLHYLPHTPLFQLTRAQPRYGLYMMPPVNPPALPSMIVCILVHI